MKVQNSRFLLAGLAIGLWAVVVLASSAPCSIRPRKGASKEELKSLAKVSEEVARKTALASLKDSAKATVKESELEAEHGCLVYSFDIAVAGKSGIEEIQIDAGNGKILSSEHESPGAEAAEKAKDKPKP